MIRIAVVDDHYAIRLGLTAAIAAEPDMEPVGDAASVAELGPLLYRTSPDVVILDYRLPDGDGLSVCRTVKEQPPAPAVLLHSAYADDWLTVPAIVAGVDGIVHKGAPGTELAQAIRQISRGETSLPSVDPGVLRSLAQALDGEDQPILAMLVHGTPANEIAATLGLGIGDVRARRKQMLARLRGEAAGIARRRAAER